MSREFRLRMKEKDFQTYFVSIPRSRVAVEAGGQSRWVAEIIEQCGHEVYVSNNLMQCGCIGDTTTAIAKQE